jgi:hypothetical protein
MLGIDYFVGVYTLKHSTPEFYLVELLREQQTQEAFPMTTEETATLHCGYCTGPFKVKMEHPTFYLIELSRKMELEAQQPPQEAPSSANGDNDDSEATVEWDLSDSQAQEALPTEVKMDQKEAAPAVTIPALTPTQEDDEDDDIPLPLLVKKHQKRKICSEVVYKQEHDSCKKKTSTPECQLFWRDGISNNDFKLAKEHAQIVIDHSDDDRDVLKNMATFEAPSTHIAKFYDLTGSEVLPMDANLAFCVCDGNVISPYYTATIIVCVPNQNQLKFKVGRVTQFWFDKKLATTKLSGVKAMFEWLHTDAMEDSKCNDVSTCSIEDALVCAPLLPYAIQARLASDYVLSLSLLESRMEISNKLQYSSSDANIAMHHALQFYHVRSSWMWRTPLGSHIVKTYMTPMWNFGESREPRHTITLAMTKTAFQVSLMQHNRVRCKCCGQVLDNAVELWKRYIGKTCCLEKLRYFHALGIIIREFRATSRFDAKRAAQLLSRMQSVQEKFHGQEIAGYLEVVKRAAFERILTQNT